MDPLIPRRPLGQTGLMVSVLGLGTVKFGRNAGVKYPEGFQLPDDPSALALLELAEELGFNLIDTAPAYGVSEERLGGLLQGRRDRWIICTKVGEEFEEGRSWHDFTSKFTRRSVERSLRRLRTDVLDLVLIHSDGQDEAILQRAGAVKELMRLKEEGKIRSVGISTKTVAGGLLATRLCDVVMIHFNPWYQEEEVVLQAAEKQGCGVLIKKAFGSGHFGETDQASDPVTESLKFALARSAVSSVVVGTINPIHLRQNAQATLEAIYLLGLGSSKG